MELEMNGFRCYKNKVMKLPTKGLVLLSGPSGSGKTSILQAITWCLYGKIRSVECKTNSKTKKMFVRWTIPANTIVSSSKTIVIYRQKHPNLLKVHFLSESSENDLELIDDVAQKRICDLFGTLGVWHLSSYLPQDQFNPLFTSSAAGGLQYLNTIAFHEDNPKTKRSQRNFKKPIMDFLICLQDVILLQEDLGK
ncbi:MAG: AAA family ATPase [Bacteroidota bacterium]